MKKKSQKDIFLEYEGNNYFQRNKEIVYAAEKDMVIRVLRDYSIKPSNVLEVGCNTGYRLAGIFDLFDDVKVCGIEPSTEAIKTGTSKYPFIDFTTGTADDMNSFRTGSFDLVIVGFVLYVVDREILLKVIAETDRVLANGGILMMIDFFCNIPSKNPYKHISEFEAFAYKQNYEDIFLSTKLYHLIDKRAMNHITKEYDSTDDYHNKYALSTLRKDINAGYR